MPQKQKQQNKIPAKLKEINHSLLLQSHVICSVFPSFLPLLSFCLYHSFIFNFEFCSSHLASVLYNKQQTINPINYGYVIYLYNYVCLYIFISIELSNNLSNFSWNKMHDNTNSIHLWIEHFQLLYFSMFMGSRVCSKVSSLQEEMQ